MWRNRLMEPTTIARMAQPAHSLLAAAVRRASSSAATLVMQRQEDGIVSLQLSSPPVNSLSLETCKELTSTLGDLEFDGETRGVIIGSAAKGIFSAGLDIRSLIVTAEHNEDSVAEFWTAVQEMWLTLYMSPLATVAAISGHCPAGGCMLALSCDARVMAEGKYMIGLNEAQLGLLAPSWFSTLLKDTIGHRRAERMLQLGQLLPPEEALAVGMVDEVVPLAALRDASHDQLHQLLQVPTAGRVMAKQQVRQNAAAALKDFQSEDLDAFMAVIMQQSVQNGLKDYLSNLRKKEGDV